jgi:hypothetical protein
MSQEDVKSSTIIGALGLVLIVFAAVFAALRVFPDFEATASAQGVTADITAECGNAFDARGWDVYESAPPLTEESRQTLAEELRGRGDRYSRLGAVNERTIATCNDEGDRRLAIFFVPLVLGLVALAVAPEEVRALRE